MPAGGARHDGRAEEAPALLGVCGVSQVSHSDGYAHLFAPMKPPRSKLRGIKRPLAYSHGPASLAGWMLVYLVYGLHANLRTTSTGRLGDAVAYSLFHCPAAEHIGA